VTLLARRDYARAELAARLADRGYDPGCIEGVVGALAGRGFLDDARYAGHFVQYHAARGQGPLRIRRELAEAGVGEVLIDEALAAIEDWPARARVLRQRRFGGVAPAAWAEKARQARFLQYRGFSTDHIRSALGPDFDDET
jgi:regulatory protein